MNHVAEHGMVNAVPVNYVYDGFLSIKLQTFKAAAQRLSKTSTLDHPYWKVEQIQYCAGALRQITSP